MKTTIRVLVAGDPSRPNAAFVGATVLDSDPRFQIVGRTGGVQQAVWTVRASSPDLVLLEVSESASWGRKFLTCLPPDFGGAVLLAAYATPIGAIAQLLQAGAHGVFCQTSPAAELPQAMIKVVKKEIWIDPAYWKPLIAAAAWAGEPAADSCTEREREILMWVRRGLGNKEIAEQMGISLTAVKAGIQRLFRKYGVQRRAQLVCATADVQPASSDESPAAANPG